MQELGIEAAQVIAWFPHEIEAHHVLVRVTPEHAGTWAAALVHAVRRCYVSDEAVQLRAQQLEAEIQGTVEFRQAQVVNSKLPDAGATMAGDFGEILIYFYQAARALPRTAFGPKRWRLKQDRTKPAPCSDVVHFILPTWPAPSDQDEILCAEVKMKSTDGGSSPIEDTIVDCAKDRTSRLSRTLQWLKERALAEPLGVVQLAHLNRFINTTDNPPATKRFRAVAVISSNLLDAELLKVPEQASPEYTLVVVAVPNLHAVYNAVYNAVKAESLPPAPQQ
ncbi:MAG TPA: Hachiman antiphage defense system protein HamA [Chthoniobacterales bacterium]